MKREHMTRISVDLEGIVPYGSLEITDKLDECRFFLTLMKRTKDWPRFRWLTSAYLNAARAALDWLAFRAHYAWFDDEGEPEADQRAVQALRKYLDLKHQIKSGKVYAHPRVPLLRDLCRHRTITAHEGPLTIKPEKVSTPKQFVFRDGGQPVIKFADDVLDLLVQIQEELWPWKRGR
jgi:hypothetical protein